MARMMHLFRKYQYILLVVFGVLLMVVFVVGDALNSLTPGYRAQQPADDVVLTWKGGQLTAGDLYNLRTQHNLAMEFLSAVAQEATRRNGSPKGLGTQLSPAQSEEELIRKMLLAAKAEAMGLKVDNEAVFDMLYQLGDGELTRSDLGVIFNQTLGQRRGFTQQRLMDQLQHELLAQQMLMLSQAGIVGQTGFVLPPHEAWELHNRMRRRAQTEMVALKVDDFKSQVTRPPTDAEVLALYEAAKDRFPDPNSPEPGFRRRPRAGFEYVRADFSKFLEEEVAKVKDSITDADIEAYYNQNKERYRMLDLPPSETSPSGGAETPLQPPANSAPGPDAPASPPAAVDPSPAEPSTNADPAPAATSPPGDEPAKQADPAPENQPQEGDTNPTPPEGQKQNSAITRPVETAFVALVDDNEAQAGEGAAAADTPTDSNAAASTEAATAPVAQESTPAAPPESPSADNPNPSPATPATEPLPATSPDANAPAAAAAEPPADAKPTAEQPKPEEPKYKPLDDGLRAEIRQTLADERARRPAQERLDKAFSEVTSAIESYGRQLRLLDMSADAAKPEPVDVVALATGPGLTAGKTDMVDPLGIEEYELGRSYETVFTSWPPQRIPFAQLAYQEGLQPYRPQRIRGEQVDLEFLYWKTAQESSYVPELNDIREEVVDAWKRQQALALAKAEAERLAKQAAADKPLGESLGAGHTVLQPPEFSWMTTGFTPFGGGAPALSAVDGVQSAGEDFMKSVFALQPGQAGVAVNQPQDTVYVVRMVEQSPDDEVLKQQFLASGVTNEVAQMAFVELGQLWQSWYDDLEREMKVVRSN